MVIAYYNCIYANPLHGVSYKPVKFRKPAKYDFGNEAYQQLLISTNRLYNHLEN